MTILQVFGALAAPGIVLLITVAQRAEHDETCKKDPNGLRWARRAAFWLTAMALGNAVYDAMSPLSILLLVTCAYGILAVNALVLHYRRPSSPDRDTDAAPVYRAPARVRRPF